MNNRFENNARNWTGLNDVHTAVTINPFDDFVFEVRENGFAGYVTTSYVIGTRRFVYYANNLRPNTSLSVQTNVI